jgi:hypothetical protein
LAIGKKANFNAYFIALKEKSTRLGFAKPRVLPALLSPTLINFQLY